MRARLCPVHISDREKPSFLASALVGHVGHVLFRRPAEQVFGVETRRVVALVANVMAFRDWPVSDDEGNAMRVCDALPLILSERKLAVSCGHPRHRPFPAAISTLKRCHQRLNLAKDALGIVDLLAHSSMALIQRRRPRRPARLASRHASTSPATHVAGLMLILAGKSGRQATRSSTCRPQQPSSAPTCSAFSARSSKGMDSAALTPPSAPVAG